MGRATARRMTGYCLSMVAAAMDGTTPTTDRMGLTFSSLQSEANFWYSYVCNQIPSGCWIQPGNTAKDKSACAQCEADCSFAGKE